MSEAIKLRWIESRHLPVMPVRASKGAAGFDLSAFGEYELAPFQPVLVRTGWEIEIPHGFEGQVRARSGLALKHGIIVPNGPGTIDSDYRGEVGVILCKITHGKPYTVRHGDRIAQLVIARVYMGPIEVVEELSETARGGMGYGSTGV